MSYATLDRTDRRILIELQKDPELSTKELAERVGVSQSPCWRRLARLQEAGVIKGRFWSFDPKKLGFELVLFVRVKMGVHDKETFKAFEEAVSAIPEVQVVQLLIGEIDYRLRVVVRSMAEYETLFHNKLLGLPGVREFESSIMVKEVKNTQALPITAD
ncbi:MAG: Lrp/AsnC family transcriptional regulator [Alphaproteobacteria bacterium]|nr:Lrp/AsnC family transcriptional regulator [Alphaproteobacteria bacterium]